MLMIPTRGIRFDLHPQIGVAFEESVFELETAWSQRTSKEREYSDPTRREEPQVIDLAGL
jgi:hypothetical protein